jgi:hypothetical protein
MYSSVQSLNIHRNLLDTLIAWATNTNQSERVEKRAALRATAPGEAQKASAFREIQGDAPHSNSDLHFRYGESPFDMAGKLTGTYQSDPPFSTGKYYQ